MTGGPLRPTEAAEIINIARPEFRAVQSSTSEGRRSCRPSRPSRVGPISQHSRPYVSSPLLWVAIFHIEEIGLWKGGFGWYRALLADRLLWRQLLLRSLPASSWSTSTAVAQILQTPFLAGTALPASCPAYFFSLLVTLPGLVRVLTHPATVASSPGFSSSLATPCFWRHGFPAFASSGMRSPGSLSVEAIFYLLFPFLMVRLDKLRFRHLLLWIGGSWMASLMITSAYVILRPDGVAHAASTDGGLFWLGVVKLNPLARLPEFLLGMGFGALFLRTQLRTGTWPILAGAAMLVGVIAFRSSIAYPILHTGLLAPAFGLLIWGVATLLRQRACSGLSASVILLERSELRLLPSARGAHHGPGLRFPCLQFAPCSFHCDGIPALTHPCVHRGLLCDRTADAQSASPAHAGAPPGTPGTPGGDCRLLAWYVKQMGSYSWTKLERRSMSRG